eukprot:6076436-Amphidinium_carterae.1
MRSGCKDFIKFGKTLLTFSDVCNNTFCCSKSIALPKCCRSPEMLSPGTRGYIIEYHFSGGRQSRPQDHTTVAVSSLVITEPTQVNQNRNHTHALEYATHNSRTKEFSNRPNTFKTTVTTKNWV